MPSPKPTPSPLREFSPLGGLLSYLVPGLGQIVQGRTGKGLMFFVCIHGLFFYGMWLGTGTVRAGEVTYHLTSNVYIPDTARTVNPLRLPPLGADLYNRLQFVGQFWVGISAWPAIYQYQHASEPDSVARKLFGDFERAPTEEEMNAVNTAGDKLLELGWVYTVIAGVLNIMVIYDAAVGPVFMGVPPPTPGKRG